MFKRLLGRYTCWRRGYCGGWVEEIWEAAPIGVLVCDTCGKEAPREVQEEFHREVFDSMLGDIHGRYRRQL